MSLFTNNTTALSYLRKEGGTRSSTLNSVAEAILCLCEANGVRLLPQFVPGHLNVLADSLSRGSQVLGSEWTLCMDVCLELFRRWSVAVDLFATSLNHRLQVYFSPMANRQAAGIEAMLQSWDHLQAYAFPPFGFIQRVLTKVRQSRNLKLTSGSILAPQTVVPGSLGASSGSAGPSPSAQGSAQPTALPSFPSEPPRARSDWLSQCERSARHFGFSSRVARQLTFYRCSSVRVNYQAKWTTYRSWCHSRGHSISRPFVAKVADFLLYLRCSLHLSYSSIASYRSMLSAAFRFVLPELSSHPVLHDLLRSFRLECPLLSSWVPPWDLLRVLSILWGPPFFLSSPCVAVLPRSYFLAVSSSAVSLCLLALLLALFPRMPRVSFFVV